jgi:hypothetical protein
VDPLATRGKVCSAKITREDYGTIAFRILFEFGGMGDVSEAVDDGVRVGISPDKGTRVLHDGKESRKVVNFAVGISPVQHTGKIEEVGALVKLGPQPSF